MNFTKHIGIVVLSLLLSGCVSPRTSDNNVVFMSSMNPPHVMYAAGYVGYTERANREQLRQLTGVDPVRTEWCAAFINAILERNGMPGSDSVSDNPLMARSFLEWGESVDEPRRGDIVVFERGNSVWQGHVAIYIGTVERNGVEYYRILGGNQSNSVNVTEYPVSRLLGIRRIENSPRFMRIARN